MEFFFIWKGKKMLKCKCYIRWHEGIITTNTFLLITERTAKKLARNACETSRNSESHRLLNTAASFRHSRANIATAAPLLKKRGSPVRCQQCNRECAFAKGWHFHFSLGYLMTSHKVTLTLIKLVDITYHFLSSFKARTCAGGAHLLLCLQHSGIRNVPSNLR